MDIRIPIVNSIVIVIEISVIAPSALMEIGPIVRTTLRILKQSLVTDGPGVCLSDNKMIL